MSGVYARLVDHSYTHFAGGDIPRNEGSFVFNGELTRQLEGRDRRFTIWVKMMGQSIQEVCLAIRGTVPTYPRDLVMDAYVLKNKVQSLPEFIELVDVTKRLVGIYGRRVILAGHSLGGSLAWEIMDVMYLDIKMAYLFSTGTGFGKFIQQMKMNIKCGRFNIARGNKTKRLCKKHNDIKKKTQLFTTKYDPISVLSRVMGAQVRGSKKLNQHSLSNFTGGNLLLRR